MVNISIEIGLVIGLADGLKGRELADFLCMEIGRFVKHQSVTVAQNIG